MAVQSDKMDFSQPDNQLSKIAEEQRKKLFPRNDYSPESAQYSATSPDAMSTGDEQGRGTGNFLDIYNDNAGTKTDIAERKDDIKINRYNQYKPYYVPA